jgi:metal-dependent amidase/aminoacylase/carboxypeptidase family protein
MSSLPNSYAQGTLPNGLEPIDPNQPIPFNHNPHYYVKDEMLKTGIRMHANVVMDFLCGQI